MSGSTIPGAVRTRLIIAAILALGAAVLTGMDTLKGSRQKVESGAKKEAAVEAIEGVVDTLLSQYGFVKTDVRTWYATPGGARTGRKVQRVVIGQGFLSILFNHELDARVAPFGAHVVATEHSREEIVTMHIVRGGATIRSITFATDGARRM
jgi:hypothetical protein